MPRALRVIASLAFDSRAMAFKVGATGGNLLRPDKLVVYFATRSALSSFARRACGSLQGMPGHGVPFAAPIDRAGLLGWAIDPPQARNGEIVAESWRIRIARELATALATGYESAPPRVASTEFATFAVTRVSLEAKRAEVARHRVSR